MDSPESSAHLDYRSWAKARRNTSIQYADIFRDVEDIGKFQQPLNFFSFKKISQVSENVTKQLKIFNLNSIMLGWTVKWDRGASNFISGSIYSKTGRVQSFWHHVLSRNCDLIVASDIYPRPSQSPDQLLVTLDYYGDKSGASVSFSSLGSLLGHRFCTQVSPSLKLGYEMYCSLAERYLFGSVGISMCLDKSRQILINSSASPLTGGLHVDIAAKIGTENMWARTYIDYNIHTTDSDFGLALKYSNQQQETLQARFSRSKGLGFYWGASLSDDLTVKFGIQFHPFHTSQNLTKSPLGFELIYMG